MSAARGRRSRRDAARERAVDAAVDLMRSGGPAAVTSVAVAHRLGVSQSAVYRYVVDVDELRRLAVRQIVEDLDAAIQEVIRSSNVDWASYDEVLGFARRLVDVLVGHEDTLELVDRWRFDDGPLGDGIREVLAVGQELTSGVLESRWRAADPSLARLTARQRSLVRAHAAFFQEDTLTVARIWRGDRRRGTRAAMSSALMSRMIGSWYAFAVATGVTEV